MSRPFVIVSAVVQDRERTCKTVWGREYAAVHEVSIVSISYINRMKSYETVPKSTSNTRSAHMVLYDRHTTNTVQVRIIHGPVRLYTVLHGLVRSYQTPRSDYFPWQYIKVATRDVIAVRRLRSYTASMCVQSSSTIIRTQTQHYKCLRLSSFIK